MSRPPKPVRYPKKPICLCAWQSARRRREGPAQRPRPGRKSSGQQDGCQPSIRGWGVLRASVHMPGDPLGLDARTMRELGYRTGALLVDELPADGVAPIVRASPAEMRARLGGPVPEAAEDFGVLLERLRTD